MGDSALRFHDSAGYERFMGRWSRAVAPVFLRWLEVGPEARWLDVGCGTGILAETVLELCAPASVHAVDPSQAQVAAAAERPAAGRIRLSVADARQLPFADASFDAVASALVLNFVPERAAALSEMRRVACHGGVLAGYVWDFAAELSPSGPLRRAMRRLGAEVPAVPGTEASPLHALQSLFAHAGLEEVTTRSIDVCLGYRDFDDFWAAQTPGYAPTSRIIAAMTTTQRGRLMRAVDSALPRGPGGIIEYCARANAVKGVSPAR